MRLASGATRASVQPDGGTVTERLPFSADLGLTGSLCVLVLVAAIGFARVYAGASWVLPVMASVVAGSLATFFGRRAGLAPPVVAACAFLAIWVTSSELVLWGTTQAGLPLLGTLRAASLASRQAAAAFMATAAPAHAAPGFVLWSAWGAGAAVVASDLLAVRLRSMAAVFPPLLVFLATCVLGLPSGRAWALTTFIAATLAFVLVHQWAWGAPATPTTLRKAGRPGLPTPPPHAWCQGVRGGVGRSRPVGRSWPASPSWPAPSSYLPWGKRVLALLIGARTSMLRRG